MSHADKGRSKSNDRPTTFPFLDQAVRHTSRMVTYKDMRAADSHQSHVRHGALGKEQRPVNWASTAVSLNRHSSMNSGDSSTGGFSTDPNGRGDHHSQKRTADWLSKVQGYEGSMRYKESSDDQERVFKRLRDLRLEGDKGASNESQHNSDQRSARPAMRVDLNGIGAWAHDDTKNK